jgi:hypothetical protein
LFGAVGNTEVAPKSVSYDLEFIAKLTLFMSVKIPVLKNPSYF